MYIFYFSIYLLKMQKRCVYVIMPKMALVLFKTYVLMWKLGISKYHKTYCLAHEAQMLSYGETVLLSSISVPIFLHPCCLDSRKFFFFFFEVVFAVSAVGVVSDCCFVLWFLLLSLLTLFQGVHIPLSLSQARCQCQFLLCKLFFLPLDLVGLSFLFISPLF